MLAPGELVEVPDIEAQIPLAIEREETRHVGDRALTATDGAAGPLADGVVVGRRFAVFAGE